MALIECQECHRMIHEHADPCPQCGVKEPSVPPEEKMLREKAKLEADERVAEIIRLGAQKKAAYVRLDELETQLNAGGVVIALLRALFPSKSSRAKREELAETARKIHSLRGRMDKLSELLPPGRWSEIGDLWNIENTTILSQLRGRR